MKSQHNQGTKEVGELLSQGLEVMGLNPILQFLADSFFQNDIDSQKVRLGGMVKKESIYKEMVLENDFKIQKITFIVTDFKNEIQVNYKGILPDLFKEGQGVVVEGNYKDNSFYAVNVLAKQKNDKSVKVKIKTLSFS